MRLTPGIALAVAVIALAAVAPEPSFAKSNNSPIATISTAPPANVAVVTSSTSSIQQFENIISYSVSSAAECLDACYGAIPAFDNSNPTATKIDTQTGVSPSRASSLNTNANAATPAFPLTTSSFNASRSTNTVSNSRATARSAVITAAGARHNAT